MGRLVGIVMASALVVLAACGDDGGTGPGPVRPDSIVSMPGFTFVPTDIAIKVGGTVIFDFPSEPHNVIFVRKTGAPTDIQVTVNRSVGRRFNLAGDFPYDCTIHPGMSGVVMVTN